MTQQAPPREPSGPMDARVLLQGLAGELARVSRDLGRIEALSSSLTGQVSDLAPDAVELLQELDRVRQTTAGLGLLLEGLAPALAGVPAPAERPGTDILLESVARRLFWPPPSDAERDTPGPGVPSLF